MTLMRDGPFTAGPDLRQPFFLTQSGLRLKKKTIKTGRRCWVGLPQVKSGEKMSSVRCRCLTKGAESSTVRLVAGCSV